VTGTDSTQRPPDAALGAPPVAATSAAPAAPAAAPGLPTAPVALAVRAGPRSETLHFMLRSRKLLLGAAIVAVAVVIAVIGPWIRTTDPLGYIGPAGMAPYAAYPLGTTTFGQDVLSQFVHGIGATLLVGLLGGGLAAVVGMTIGFVAGYKGGWVDEVLSMFTNVVLVIPTLVVLLLISAYLQVRGELVEAIFIGLTSWPWAARAIRAQTFSLASREFVDLARLSGAGSRSIIVREIAPNMASYLFMTFILLFGGAILIGATIEFIGLGPTEGISLGLMMNNAVRWSALPLGLWWWFIPPGLAITIIVGSLYVMNVGLDEVFNPRLRET
jgi:peptide/nickel transport system permease protein